MLNQRKTNRNKMGVNIHVFQSQTDANGKPIGEHGSYHLRDGSIHIDLNAGNLGQGVMVYTISHEFTHFMEQQSPAKFQAFTDALFAELDVDVEAEIERKAKELKRQHPEQYKNASRDTLLEDARSEVVAEACETMLTDTDAANRIGQSLKAKDATLFEKVKQWFRDLAAKLREAYKDLHPDSEIAQYAKKTIQQVDGLVQMWADMAVDATENYREGAGNGNAELDGGVKFDDRKTNYDYSKPFSQQVDDWLNNLFPDSDTLLVGGTPKVLKKIGFPQLPITISQVNLKANLKGQYRGNQTEILDHLMDPEDFKNLPELIADPIAIIADRRLQHNVWTVSEHSVDVLVEMVINGKQTLVPIKIDGKGMQNGTTIDALNISSVHGNRDAYDRLIYALENDDDNHILAFYVNKDKATAVLQKAGHTITGWPNISNGFNHSITDPGSPVNIRIADQTETRQFKNWFRGSKIVNADGTPKIVYHQTSSEFTIFDPRHEGAGTRDSDTPFGIFLKSSDKDIGLKGGKQMALYARIANPLVVQNREELIYRLRTISNDYSQAADELRDLNADYSKKSRMQKKHGTITWRNGEKNTLVLPERHSMMMNDSTSCLMPRMN